MGFTAGTQVRAAWLGEQPSSVLLTEREAQSPRSLDVTSGVGCTTSALSHGISLFPWAVAFRLYNTILTEQVVGKAPTDRLLLPSVPWTTAEAGRP